MCIATYSGRCSVRSGPKNAVSKFTIYTGLVGLVAERKVHRRTLTNDRNVEITGRNLREEALPADGTPSPNANPSDAPDAVLERTIVVVHPRRSLLGHVLLA